MVAVRRLSIISLDISVLKGSSQSAFEYLRNCLFRMIQVDPNSKFVCTFDCPNKKALTNFTS